MKQVTFIFIAFVFFKPILGQNITYQNSSDTSCKFYQGRLPKTIADSATYIYFISKHSSFIEISTLTWGSIITKYRVARQPYSQTFTVTKCVENRTDSTSTCFIAIDSSMFNELQISKNFKDLKNRNILIERSKKEPLVLDYFSTFIVEHNLQSQYFNFKPNLFIAWFKTKSKGK